MVGRKPGHEVSAETRAKISASLKGRKALTPTNVGRKQPREEVEKRAALMRSPLHGTVCKAPGCEKIQASIGLCSTHYARWWRTGSIADPPVRETGYHGVHIRARKNLPRKCLACGGDGSASPLQVALTHNPHPLSIRTDPRGQIYSINPADYIRLCAKCHKQYDSPIQARRDAIIALLTR